MGKLMNMTQPLTKGLLAMATAVPLLVQPVTGVSLAQA